MSKQQLSDDETEFIYDSSNLEQINQKLLESRVQILQAKEDKKSLNEQNKELVVQIGRQNELLELKHKQNQQLTQEVKTLKEQLDDRELKLLQAVKDKQSLQNELINQGDIIAQVTSKNDQLNSELFAIKLSMEQIQQTANLNKQEVNQATTRELRLKEQLDHLNKQIRVLEEQVRKGSTQTDIQLNTLKSELHKKQNEINDLKRQQQQQMQQNADIIAELIEQKNQNLQNSICNKEYKPELSKLTKENEELKQRLRILEINIQDKQQIEIQLKQEIAILRSKLNEQHNVIITIGEQIKQKDDKLNNLQSELESQTQNQNIVIDNLNQQITLLKQQEILSNKTLLKSVNSDVSKDLQIKNEQIAMLQNENNQLVKLIETLKNQRIGVQEQDQQKIKHLESELRNLSSFIYESPLVVLFNLLEDRLSKQQQKSHEQKNNLKMYWTNQLKQWGEGFEELKQAFAGIKIQFTYQIKYQ